MGVREEGERESTVVVNGRLGMGMRDSVVVAAAVVAVLVLVVVKQKFREERVVID